MPPAFRFGHHSLDPQARALEAAGQPVALGARAYDVLLALVERRDRVVTKGELLDVVWKGMVVEENNLQVQISTLRKVLGSKAIATIPGRGYQFVLPVESAASTPLALAELRDKGSASGLFGRDDDLRQLTALSRQNALVTVTGPGGVGKTVLARALLEAADQQSGWVELAAVTAGEQVLPAFASALGVRLPGGDAFGALAAALANRKLRVVIDNAEHLVDAVGKLVSDLRDALPDLRLVVTSQAPLAVRDEHVYHLEPLDCPSDAKSATVALGYGAVALFAARATAADRRFALTDVNAEPVAAICRQLDGLPLAIELAAARVRELGVTVLRDSLAQRFRMLTSRARTAPARQQSLRSALEWSHSLLDENERALFRRLGVFANGFTLPLALAVAGEGDGDWATIDRLAALAERSLIAVSGEEPPRYSLPETMRAFALEQLAAAGEESAIRERHARAVHALFTATRSDVATAAHKVDVQRELDNAREAFLWAREHDAALAIDLASTAARHSVWSPRRTEALGWLASCEPIVSEAVPRRVRAEWWLEFARFQLFNRSPQSVNAARRALELYRQVGDERKVVEALAALVRSSYEPSTSVRDALAEMDALLERNPEWPPQMRYVVAGTHAHYATTIDEDLTAALRYRKEEAGFAEAMGSPRALNGAETNVIAILRHQEQHDEVCDRARRLIARLRGSGEIANLAYANLHLLNALLATGRLDEARDCALEAWQACQAMNLPLAADPTAVLTAMSGRLRTAARLAAYARARNAHTVMADVTVAYLAQVDALVKASLPQSDIAVLTSQGAHWSDEEAFRAAFESTDP